MFNGYVFRCGGRIAVSTWDTNLVVPLRATVDSVKDGDARGQLQVTISVSCAGEEVYSKNISTVQVSTL